MAAIKRDVRKPASLRSPEHASRFRSTSVIAKSRLKDFYDLWLIAQTFEFRQSTLVEAVRRTFERRETKLPTNVPIGLSDAYTAAWGAQWQTFLGRERMAAAPAVFAAVIADLRAFLISLAGTVDVDRIWLTSRTVVASRVFIR